MAASADPGDQPPERPEPGSSGEARRLRAYVGLGANLGDPPTRLAGAIAALGALPAARLVGVSRLYVTRPVGPLAQPDFHNAVAALDVPASPDPVTGALALLSALKGLERAFGRRDGPRWGPRELDLDLLVHGPHRIRVVRPDDARSGRPERAGAEWLEVPHPAAAERLFVLAPLADLAADLVPPGWPESVAAAARRARAREGPDAVRAVGAWEVTSRSWVPLPAIGHGPLAETGPGGRPG